jgi:hypothetical protein
MNLPGIPDVMTGLEDLGNYSEHKQRIKDSGQWSPAWEWYFVSVGAPPPVEFCPAGGNHTPIMRPDWIDNGAGGASVMSPYCPKCGYWLTANTIDAKCTAKS